MVSKFYNIFNTSYLGNLPAAEWRTLVQQAYARSGRSLSPQVLARIGHLAGGHPHLTQLAGFLHWKAQEAGWNEAEIDGRFAVEAKMIFTDLLQRLDAEQIQALRHAMGMKGVPGAPVNVVNDLKMYGVLNAAGEIFCRPFADFILQEAG
jgi:hypothetical protein